MSRNKKPTTPAIRCAIYTRKSSEEGLELEFNSLDAQRESAEAFIASQQHEGWVCLPEHYDDGGFSGGSMERPALHRLLADIAAGKVDCVVVYKVDRLSRSLLDFSRIMETFDKNGASFVSVTQQFNTTHSMGRLTLNILLSFAQFEREIIGERIRDKIAAQRRKGKWAGGVPMLGYDVDRTNPSAKLRSLANASSPSRWASSGIAPPPANGSCRPGIFSGSKSVLASGWFLFSSQVSRQLWRIASRAGFNTVSFAMFCQSTRSSMILKSLARAFVQCPFTCWFASLPGF